MTHYPSLFAALLILEAHKNMDMATDMHVRKDMDMATATDAHVQRKDKNVHEVSDTKNKYLKKIVSVRESKAPFSCTEMVKNYGKIN